MEWPDGYYWRVQYNPSGRFRIDAPHQNVGWAYLMYLNTESYGRPAI
jgi:hypothetical protein